MKTSALLFPVIVAGVCALDGCNALDAIGPHPAVRLCHNDTVWVQIKSGQVTDSIPAIWWERNPNGCRKAA